MSTPTLDIRPLSPVLQKKAIEELNEVPSRMAEDVAALRSWIEKQPHLKARTHDQFLVMFLRGCKYSLEKAKKKLDKYYTLRGALPFPDFTFVDDPKARAMVRMGIMLYLPLPMVEDGPRLALMRPGFIKPDEFNFIDMMKISFLMQDAFLISDDQSNICGFLQIGDFENFSMQHFFQMQPSHMRIMGLYAEEGLPVRINGQHFFNTGAVFEKVFAVVKTLMPPKMKERLYVHADLNSMSKVIPIKYLPKEYGGENGSIDEIAANIEEMILKNREYLLEERNYGTDEKLRVGGKFDYDALFGTEGSFRKLDVD